jgi:hypothetical protein
LHIDHLTQNPRSADAFADAVFKAAHPPVKNKVLRRMFPQAHVISLLSAYSGAHMMENV